MTVANNRYVQVSSRQQRGFTLIELMVAVAIVAIIISVALPSYNSFIERSRVRIDLSKLKKNIRYANDTARLTGQIVRVDADASGWGEGYTIWVDKNNDGVRDFGEAVREQGGLLTSLVVKGGIIALTTFTFRHDGTIDNGVSITMDICPMQLRAQVKGSRITLLPSGILAITDTRLCTNGGELQ